MLRDMDVLMLTQGIIQLLVTSLQFTSLVVMVYIFTKCISKSKKGSIIIGVILWWVINYFVNQFILSVLGINAFDINSGTTDFILYNGITMLFVALYYWISVKLIENKLEVY